MVERGYSVREVAERVGVSAHSLHKWVKTEFTVDQPNLVWVTDVTYIRTWQGWPYLAALMDLYARNIVGWSNRDPSRSKCCGVV